MFLESLKYTGIILGMFLGGFLFVWLWSKLIMFYMNKTMYLTGKKAYIVHTVAIILLVYLIVLTLTIIEGGSR